MDFFTILGFIGRLIFGGYFVWNGVNHFRKHKHLTDYATSRRVPMPSTAVYGTGALLIFAGASVMLGAIDKVALSLIALFLLVVTFKMHPYWKAVKPEEKNQDVDAFFRNAVLFGATLYLMSF